MPESEPVSFHDDAPLLADRPAARDPQRGGKGRTIATAAAPLAASLALILADHILPNQQSVAASGYFRRFLPILLCVAGIVAVSRFFKGRGGRWARKNSALVAGAIGLLLAWDLVTVKWNWLPLPYFPGPQRVLASLIDDRETLAISAYHSLRLLLAGYLLGAACGLACGILIGWFRQVRYWGMPLLKAIGPIPATAYVPLVMVMFPNQFLSSTALIALAVWFPMTMLTSSGIANVPLAYLDVARTLGAQPRYLIFHVALPAALPSVFLGLFMGLGAAFLTLIVAETLGVSSGLGWYLKWQQGYLEYSNVYAALAIMSLFFSGLMTLLFAIRDRVLNWQKGEIRW